MKRRNTVIGFKMARAVPSVRDNPGCCIKFVAERITPCRRPESNWAYGYNPVWRAIRAGLINAGAGKGNSYALHVAGEAA